MNNVLNRLRIGGKLDCSNPQRIEGNGAWSFRINNDGLNYSELALDLSMVKRLTNNMQVFSKYELSELIFDLIDVYNNMCHFTTKERLGHTTKQDMIIEERYIDIINKTNDEVIMSFPVKQKELASKICLKMNYAEI